MHVIKGYTRAGAGVVNTETTGLELIKQRRLQKRSQDQAASELDQLREMVLKLTERVRILEERNG